MTHDIDDLSEEGTGLPAEGGAGLENDLQVGIAATQPKECFFEQSNVVAFSRQQMSSAEIQPFEAGQPASKAFFEMHQRARQIFRRTFAVTMTMKTLDGCGQFVGQFVGEHAETTARRTGIVEFRFNFTILRVDAQSDGGCVVSHLLQTGQEAFKLREGVEGQVGRARCDLVKGVFFVGGRIGVGFRSELVEGEHSLVK